MNPATARQLLDADAMTAVLAQAPNLEGRRLETVELVSSWIKPGRYFNAHYHVRLEGDQGEPLAISAFLVDQGRASRALGATGEHSCGGRGYDRGCRACATKLVEPGILLQVYPVDYRLPTLPYCLDLDRVNAQLEGRFEMVESKVVAYRPGMRCQVFYRTLDRVRIYGKVVVEKYGRGAAVELQRELARELSAENRCFSIAKPLTYLPELQLELVRALKGKSLRFALWRQLPVDDKIPLISEAIADFHAIGAGSRLRHYRADDELDTIDRWAELVALLCPERGSDLNAAQGELIRDRPESREPRALLHRDFYDQQVLFDRGRPLFIDMDTTSRGDPEIDIGNFCAHLWVRGVQWSQPERFRDLSEQFLAAYPGTLSHVRIMWYRRATLLRLACVYSLRRGLDALVAALIDEAKDACM